MADKDVTTKLTLQGDASGVTSALDKAQTDLKKTDTAVGGLDKSVFSLNGQFVSLTSITKVAAGALGGMGLVSLTNQLHQAGMESERLRNSFEAAAGGVQKGADAYAYARNESQRLGLDLQSTAEAFKSITASAKGTSLEGEKTQRVFSSVAGASRALGLSGDQMSGALLAISQMMSKGTVQAEELRGQLGERIPGSFQIAARAMGVTTAELGKMLEGGKVVAEDFLPKFAAELEKTFPPGEKAMSGLTAETMRLKTAMYELKTTVMDSGGDSIFSGAIRGMTTLNTEATLLLKTLKETKNLKMYGTAILASTAAGAGYGTVAAPGLGTVVGGVVGFGAGVAGTNMVAHSTGALDANRPLPPATKFDNNLIGGIDLGTSARTDSLFTPQFSNRMRSPDEYTDDFGATLSRNTLYEEKKKTGTKPHPKDLLLEQILSYQKDMEQINTTLMSESAALTESGNFRALAFDLNAAGTTGARYKKSGSYSLLGPGPNTVKQEADPEQGYGLALEARYTADSYNSGRDRRNQESLESEKMFLAEQAALRGDNSALELARIEREQQAQEQSWAMNTDSFEEYERRKGMIAEVFAEKRKRLEQQTTIANIQQYGMYASNVSTLANNLYQLSGKRSRELFYIAKAVSIGQTTINTAEAVMKAYAQTGIFGGPVAAAIVGAVGASQIALIAAQQPDGGGTVNSSNSGSFSMPSGGGPVTQPVNQQPTQGLTVTFAPVFHGPVDQQALNKWTEDYFLPTLRDLKTRGVSA